MKPWDDRDSKKQTSPPAFWLLRFMTKIFYFDDWWDHGLKLLIERPLWRFRDWCLNSLIENGKSLLESKRNHQCCCKGIITKSRLSFLMSLLESTRREDGYAHSIGLPTYVPKPLNWWTARTRDQRIHCQLNCIHYALQFFYRVFFFFWFPPLKDLAI